MKQKYQIVITEEARRELRKITSADRERVLKYISKNIATAENPRSFGKPLTGDKTGLWRYRVGIYRIVCDIFDNELVIEALHIGKRSDIYDMF